MPSFMLHCIRSWLGIAPILLLAGCWQKIEYTGSGSSTANTQSSPPSAVAEAKPAKSAPATPIESPPPIATTGAPSTEVDRYASSTKAAEPISTPTPATPTPSLTEPAPNILKPPQDLPVPKSTTTAPPKLKSEPIATPPKSERLDPAAKPAVSEAPAPKQTPPPATRHMDARPTSATIGIASRPASPNTRRAAWQLGSRLSLAALANDRGLAPDNVPKWFDEARSAAKLLGTSIPDLPESSAAVGSGLVSQIVLDYLEIQYDRIARLLRQRQGPEVAALFEVALKSNYLLVLYSPGSSEANSISAAISRAAPQARLPAELWKPLVDTLGKRSSLSDVRAAVRKMHNDTDQYLATAAEPGSR